jgi:phosphohistidine phosphatase SixA
MQSVLSMSLTASPSLRYVDAGRKRQMQRRALLCVAGRRPWQSDSKKGTTEGPKPIECPIPLRHLSRPDDCRLILLRHAKSSWKDAENISDRERPLAQKGRNRARATAEALAVIDWIPDLIITSDAKRCVETLDVMTEAQPEFKKADVVLCPEFYDKSHGDEEVDGGATAKMIAKVVEREVAGRKLPITVMCIGHNYGWERAYQRLTSEGLSDDDSEDECEDTLAEQEEMATEFRSVLKTSYAALLGAPGRGGSDKIFGFYWLPVEDTQDQDLGAVPELSAPNCETVTITILRSNFVVLIYQMPRDFVIEDPLREAFSQCDWNSSGTLCANVEPDLWVLTYLILDRELRKMCSNAVSVQRIRKELKSKEGEISHMINQEYKRRIASIQNTKM